jgi:putative hydrolase of the HAD superfamily
MTLEALILDYGNVLSRPQREDWFEAMAAQFGVQTNAFRDAYWRHRQPYDTGLPAAEYWRRVLETLGDSSRAVDEEAVIDRLVKADVASWTEYREEVWDLAQSFRVEGGRTAFLSNGVPEAMARIRAEHPLERWFDVVVVSCEVGVAKPDPVIFQMCLSQLGVKPSEALFVDDRIENITGAASLGIQTFHFVGADAVSQLVRSVRSLSG